jgi:hypothetical protein
MPQPQTAPPQPAGNFPLQPMQQSVPEDPPTKVDTSKNEVDERMKPILGWMERRAR